MLSTLLRHPLQGGEDVKPVYTNKIARDIRKAKKQGKELEKFKNVVRLLVEQKVIDKKYSDHSLTGNYNRYRECHIEPDWL